MEEGREVGRSLMKREKVQGQEQILAKHLDGLERNDFCDFEKPRKCACQKGKIESNEQSKEGRPAEITLWKRAGCQTESKAFVKSIERIVRELGLGLLNPFKLD